jgi:hypothetical protein
VSVLVNAARGCRVDLGFDRASALGRSLRCHQRAAHLHACRPAPAALRDVARPSNILKQGLRQIEFDSEAMPG